jgi:hypothetical protein
MCYGAQVHGTEMDHLSENHAIGSSCHLQPVPWQLMPLATHAMGNSYHWQLTLWQVMPLLATHDIGIQYC